MTGSGVAVYAGKGSSHSWTWLADLFEAHRILNVRFLDSREFISFAESSDTGIAIVSGGDGFAIAEALKGHGFSALEGFITRGGSFVGICAGAYLPLPSTVEPFSEFNLSTTKIENIVCDLPSSHDLSPRVSVPYGRCSIVHPLRGAVKLQSNQYGPVLAPLYGGPIFKEPVRDEVLIRYAGFTPETESQIDRESAESMIDGHSAVIRAVHGEGELLLFGPHLEHPGFSDANSLFLDIIGMKRASRSESRKARTRERAVSDELRASISGVKVAILGLENRSFTVGRKSWDGSRLLELVSAIDKRAWAVDAAPIEAIMSRLDRAKDLLLKLKVGSDSDADEITSLLADATRSCVDEYFEALRRNAD